MWKRRAVLKLEDSPKSGSIFANALLKIVARRMCGMKKFLLEAPQDLETLPDIHQPDKSIPSSVSYPGTTLLGAGAGPLLSAAIQCWCLDM